MKNNSFTFQYKTHLLCYLELPKMKKMTKQRTDDNLKKNRYYFELNIEKDTWIINEPDYFRQKYLSEE